MMMTTTPHTVVLGLGNPLRGDDGVGLAVAARVAGLLAAAPIDGVVVRSGARGGFDLIELLAGARRAIVLDCLELPSPEPGRVRRVPLDRIAGSARLVGAHDLNLAAALELGRLLGLPMPRDVEVFGVEVEDTTRLVEALSPAVARVVDPLAACVYEHLGASLSALDTGPGQPGAGPGPESPANRSAPSISGRDAALP